MIVTRFAPSPSGRMHLGHAFSAMLGYTRAREHGGAFHLRIEDLDHTRCRPEFTRSIEEDLRWLGISWDPSVLVQSKRTAVYEAALDRLKSQQLVFACYCTRSDIAQSLNAPHGEAATFYPGTCRNLVDDPIRRANTPHCWRLNSTEALARVGLPTWIDADGRQFTASPEAIGDVIVARKDAPASYHLSCVLDDSASNVTLVVRGADLRPSTPIQRLLQKLLDLPEPGYLHHPLVTHLDGRRLAKRDHAPTLGALRDAGVDGAAVADGLIAGKLPLGFRFSDA